MVVGGFMMVLAGVCGGRMVVCVVVLIYDNGDIC